MDKHYCIIPATSQAGLDLLIFPPYTASGLTLRFLLDWSDPHVIAPHSSTCFGAIFAEENGIPPEELVLVVL